MKKLLLLTKTLLAAALLCVGQNAWGETKTLYPTGSIDPTSTSVWAYHANVTATQDSENDLISFVHSQGKYVRNAYLNFYTTGSDIYGGYDTYTVSFDFLNTNCWTNTNSNTAEIVLYGEGASFPSPLYNTYISANSTKRNAVLYLSRTGTWINSFNPNGDTETTIGNFSGNAWYTASITVTRSTGKVSYLITPKGSSTPVTNGSGNFTASSGETSFNCQGIFLTFGSSYTVKIANVKVTTEVVTATIGANGFTTFASPSPLVLTSAAQTANGFTAYRASAVNSETVTFKDDVNQAVVANTGILLRGTPDTDVTIPVATSGTELADNALQVNAAGTVFDKAVNTKYYGMNKDVTPLTFGEFDPSSVAIPANKAYLTVATGGGARAIVGVFGDITGVENVEAAPAEAKAKEGKFIENGKLVIVKNGQKFNVAGQQVK